MMASQGHVYIYMYVYTPQAESMSPLYAAHLPPSVSSLPHMTELAQQVMRVVKAISNAGLRCRSALMTGGEEDRDRRNKSWRTQVRTR